MGAQNPVLWPHCHPFLLFLFLLFLVLLVEISLVLLFLLFVSAEDVGLKLPIGRCGPTHRPSHARRTARREAYPEAFGPHAAPVGGGHATAAAAGALHEAEHNGIPATHTRARVSLRAHPCSATVSAHGVE
jgi:hypothetical protein